MRISKILSVTAIAATLWSCGGGGNTNQAPQTTEPEFVKVVDGKLSLNGKPYVFKGVNYWYAGNMAITKEGKERLCRELDKLKSLGISNLRVQMASEGNFQYSGNNSPSLQPEPLKFNQEMFAAYDFFLTELAKRDMTAVMILNNYWFWSGGMPWYVEQTTGEKCPVPDNKPGAWGRFMSYSDSFYTCDTAQKVFRAAIDTIVNHVNTITGKKYSDEPAIMSWQLANEPRNHNDSAGRAAMLKWVDNTAAYIHSLDKNHLVSTGSEGEAGHWFDIRHWTNIHACKSVDYVTIHLWPQNWSWFDPKREAETIDTTIVLATKYVDRHIAIADSLGKPIVVEEFGMARDGGRFEYDAPATYRNRFLKFVLDHVKEKCKTSNLMGSNVWGFSGEAVPTRPGEPWKVGDPFSGDPPHEQQGWYGIYNTDTATLNLFKE
ncbi:MAG: cellulase family glycosylhydrolase [Bacteroidales bacterium]|nr:cellulase family glycosylhydrolase [Bacteroidales bacterium]